MAAWLVTGGSGFLGRHLLAILRERRSNHGLRVVALGRRCPTGWSLEDFIDAGLDDLASLSRSVRAVAPEVVFHLAGQTPPAAPQQFYQGNTRATSHLLEALRGLGRRVRIVLAGSAAELGPVPEGELPIGESTRCRPVDAYGLSKWFASALGLRAAPPLEVMVARVFNPIGPGLPARQAFGRFARELAEPGPDPRHLTVGDLGSRRDFIDVRDVARAFVALAERGRAGLVYHVGSGHSRRVGDGLEHLIRLSGRAVILSASPDLPGARGRGPRDSRGDIRRIVEHTGWSPRVDWEQSLADLWDEVRGGAHLPLTPGPARV